MDRLNHVKIVTPDPEAVDRFLREVLEMPAGWRIPAVAAGEAPSYPPAEPRPVTFDGVLAGRGVDGSGGFITGSTESRQLQLLGGPRAQIWSVAIGTRHIERAHRRCLEAGIPCSEMRDADWTERDRIRAFFAEVGGITFEVLRVEPKP
jgi:catechol 2,3-dioxygenase-like lactoylglutathione lyase family enzyme